MRTEVDRLVTERALRLISERRNLALFDHEEIADQLGTKNVCAKVSPALAAEIDEVAGLLGISKRRFLEAAMCDAVFKAQAIIREEGLWPELEYADGSEQANAGAESMSGGHKPC